MLRKIFHCIVALLALTAGSYAYGNFEDYLSGSLRGRIPGLALRFTPEDIAQKTFHPYGAIILTNIWDSRQIFGGTEDIGLLFPKPKDFDQRGRDRNGHPSFHMTTSPTTFGVLINGPLFNDYIRSGAVIETNFRGGILAQSYGDVHIRNMLTYFDTDDWQLLLGEFWHPNTIPYCWPLVISFNAGAPFESVSRAPQIRFTKIFNNVSFITGSESERIEFVIAGLSQFDYESEGPYGPSRRYIQNAVVPNINAHIRAHDDHYYAGLSFDYKRLKPRLVSDTGIKVDEHIDSFMTEAYLRLNFTKVVIRSKAIWAQNANDQAMISGYGVERVNPINDFRTYANTACASTWLDLEYIIDPEHAQLGIFAGYTKNLGANKKLFIDPRTQQPIIYGLLGVSQNVDDMYRISPRAILQYDPFVFAFEFEWTRTAWGTPNAYGKVPNGVPVGNVRFIAEIAYVF